MMITMMIISMIKVMVSGGGRGRARGGVKVVVMVMVILDDLICRVLLLFLLLLLLSWKFTFCWRLFACGVGNTEEYNWCECIASVKNSRFLPTGKTKSF